MSAEDPPPTPCLPVELWEVVFGYVVTHGHDDLLLPVGGLLNCALTCRQWALIALPLLYKTHGYGVLLPLPGTRDPRATFFHLSHKPNLPTPRHLQLWRTLLLSCFTAANPAQSRFITFRGATLFPYIHYIRSLDLRTLVNSLSALEYSLPPKCSADFFAGALGAFEIRGAKRGVGGMVVGGAGRGRGVGVYVGDTAVMIFDFLYPFLGNLAAVSIPELGEIKTAKQQHLPLGLISRMRGLNDLLISSSWMLCAPLADAIPSNPQKQVNLVVKDWRLYTHYINPSGSRGIEVFFAALPEGGVRSLDIDFAGRLEDRDLHSLLKRQARGLRAVRVARGRFLDDVFAGLAEEGLRLEAVALEEVTFFHDPVWSTGVFERLRCVEVKRVKRMFRFCNLVVGEGVECLNLEYDARHMREEGAEEFFLRTLPAARGLRTLRMVDTEHELGRHSRPVGRVVYPRRIGEEAPVEKLTGLERLVLVGDVAGALVGDNWERLVGRLKRLRAIDVCVSQRELEGGKLRVFARCRRLERLMLREWNWDVRMGGAQERKKMTVETVRGFVDEGRAVRVNGGGKVCVLRELGIAGGLLAEVAGEQNWGELKKWAARIGCAFEWNPKAMACTP